MTARPYSALHGRSSEMALGPETFLALSFLAFRLRPFLFYLCAHHASENDKIAASPPVLTLAADP